MNSEVVAIQHALRRAGYVYVSVDGIMGPKTRAAIVEYETAKGYPPWLIEMAKYFFMHEQSDNKALRRWLRSDGPTLGDPAALPWCGDAVETAIKNTLPDEPFSGPLADNPYWARNWAHFGEESDPRVGAVVVMTRGSGGHVAFAIAHDPRRKRVLIRGGNQSNMINDMWVYNDRIICYRKPITYYEKLMALPIIDSSNGKVSINEA